MARTAGFLKIFRAYSRPAAAMNGFNLFINFAERSTVTCRAVDSNLVRSSLMRLVTAKAISVLRNEKQKSIYAH